MTDKGLAILALRANSLTYFYIDAREDYSITDKGVQRLSGLTALQTLHIESKQITASAFSSLSSLKSLQLVEMYCPKLRKAQVPSASSRSSGGTLKFVSFAFFRTRGRNKGEKAVRCSSQHAISSNYSFVNISFRHESTVSCTPPFTFFCSNPFQRCSLSEVPTLHLRTA